VKIFAVVELRFDFANTVRIQFRIQRHLIAQRSAHQNPRAQGAEIKGRAHGFRSPKLDVVGIVMRFFDPTLVPGVPRFDAEIETAFDFWPERSQPSGIAADPPVAIDLDDAAKLTVRRRVKIMLHRPDGKVAPKLLMSRLVL